MMHIGKGSPMERNHPLSTAGREFWSRGTRRIATNRSNDDDDNRMSLSHPSSQIPHDGVDERDHTHLSAAR